MAWQDDCGAACPECGTGCSRSEAHVRLSDKSGRQHRCPNPRCFNIWPK